MREHMDSWEQIARSAVAAAWREAASVTLYQYSRHGRFLAVAECEGIVVALGGGTDPAEAYRMLTAMVVRPEGPVMQTAEVAQALGATRQLVHDWLAKGKLPALVHGGRGRRQSLFAPSAVWQMIREHQKAAAWPA